MVASRSYSRSTETRWPRRPVVVSSVPSSPASACAPSCAVRFAASTEGARPKLIERRVTRSTPDGARKLVLMKVGVGTCGCGLVDELVALFEAATFLRIRRQPMAPATPTSRTVTTRLATRAELTPPFERSSSDAGAVPSMPSEPPGGAVAVGSASAGTVFSRLRESGALTISSVGSLRREVATARTSTESDAPSETACTAYLVAFPTSYPERARVSKRVANCSRRPDASLVREGALVVASPLSADPIAPTELPSTDIDMMRRRCIRLGATSVGESIAERMRSSAVASTSVSFVLMRSRRAKTRRLPSPSLPMYTWTCVELRRSAGRAATSS